MKVKVAGTAGFCFGVQRAVDKVYELIEKSEDKPIFTLGPIIHNEEVVKDLEKKGVRAIEVQELDTLPKDSIVVIRSHGVGKEVYDLLKENNLSYVDVTCPFVLKIHRIVERESKKGAHIVIDIDVQNAGVLLAEVHGSHLPFLPPSNDAKEGADAPCDGQDDGQRQA